MLQKKLGEKLREGESLKNHTTFRIGGPARYFYVAENKGEIAKAARAAQKLKIPYYILGGGSNILVSDAGFNGLVIKIQNSKFKIQNFFVVADSGLPLAKLVSATVKSGLSGLEFAAGIPGTVGGAVYGNIGRPELEKGNIGAWLDEVTVLRQGKIMKLKKDECGFKYRQSIFKYNQDIILEVKLRLIKGEPKKSQGLIKRYLIKRKEGHLESEPSAGSIFKNPAGDFAGRLIEAAGLKGQRIGGAKVSAKHANFIINSGQATADDVRQLINLIKQKVRDQFNIQLIEEIQYLGF